VLTHRPLFDLHPQWEWAARSLVFPLPAPGSVPKKAPLAWDPSSPDHGLGYRHVALAAGSPRIEEIAWHAQRA
jgi:hypothetical protein